MNLERFNNFEIAVASLRERFKTQSDLVHTEKWQGIDIAKHPEMATHELRHVFFGVLLNDEERLDVYRSYINPSLPWADDHFEERICGQPINPGIQWAKWPWGHNAKKFLNADGQFNHNYMQRYWPKQAGSSIPTKTAKEYEALVEKGIHPNTGIWHNYGDLNDVVSQLEREPLTRQAILPVFFPEDTGAVHGGRVPCTMYYQFIVRQGKMDIVYAIRSCDFVRHFRDDVYMTVRLLLWMLDELRKRDSKWNAVKPGKFVMMITSLHFFRNDWRVIFPEIPEPTS